MRMRSAIALAAAMFTLAPAVSMADDFNIEMFRPSAHPYDMWNTRTTHIADHLDFGGGLLLRYGHNPLRFVREHLNGTTSEHIVIGNQLGADLFGSIALWDYLSVGVGVPVHFVMSGDSGFVTVPGQTGAISGASMGDVRLDLKGSFIKYEDYGIGVGMNLVTSFPTNAGAPYGGDDGFTIAPQLIIDAGTSDFVFSFNGGARFRTEEQHLAFLSVENELLLGAGLMGDLFSLLNLRDLGEFWAIGEFQSTANLSSPFENENQSQIALRAGLRYLFPFGLGIEAGGGGGLVQGYGNPVISAFLGIRFDPPRGPKDADGDGILDDVDQCPLEPEDFDNFEDRDGCPDPDNDQDGILDVNDQCPNDPEDFDGFEDADGCPDPDNDQDGIPDVEDRCPNEPEDFDGFEDEDGCPDPDNDQDGILDTVDQCPNDPETKNNYEDEDGCPDEKKRARIEGKKIVILDKVFFVYDKSIILDQSFPILMEVADILNENPQIKKVLIEGHTDSNGSDRYNKRLSDRRAKAVRDFLVKQGISNKRLLFKGFGEERPIATNDTDEGRQKNRRVEFTIIEVEGDLPVESR